MRDLVEALQAGDLVLDGGWLRVSLGDERPCGLIVATDVLGGVFALRDNRIHYFAPDTLEWEDLEFDLETWLAWLGSGSLDGFYHDLRWPGWEQEVAALEPGQGIAVYPFLWSEEAQQDLAATARRPAPLTELRTLNTESCQQMDLPDPGF